jgi:uncharacterized protein YbcV (DUF1398 family)
MFTLAQIELAHSEVRSGADFPKYIQEITNFGVISFETWVMDIHTNYFGNEGFRISSDAKYAPLVIEDFCDEAAFKHALKIHQKGETDYFTFCQDCAKTGIEKWVVDLHKMSCTYFDKAENVVLVELIPSV